MKRDLFVYSGESHSLYMQTDSSHVQSILHPCTDTDNSLTLALGKAGVTALLLSCMAQPGQGASVLAWRWAFDWPLC